MCVCGLGLSIAKGIINCKVLDLVCPFEKCIREENSNLF